MATQKYSTPGAKISGLPAAGHSPSDSPVTSEVAPGPEASESEERGFAWSISLSVGALPSVTKSLP